MYSLVLMAALSTGGEAPNFFFHKWGGHGCGGWSCHGWSGHGCSGYSSYGCSGYGCSGYSCSGWGCHGCSGWGGCHGLGLRHRWFGGHGCSSACHGCSGTVYYGCSGCSGACYGCSGMMHGCAVPMMAPAAPMAEPIGAPKQGSRATTPAKLVVELPENAKLYVDDQLMKVSSPSKTFNTPALQPGQTYYYILRAEVVRDGKTLQETQRILVQAGQTVNAKFSDLERSLAATPAAATAAESGDDQ